MTSLQQYLPLLLVTAMLVSLPSLEALRIRSLKWLLFPSDNTVQLMCYGGPGGGGQITFKVNNRIVHTRSSVISVVYYTYTQVTDGVENAQCEMRSARFGYSISNRIVLIPKLHRFALNSKTLPNGSANLTCTVDIRPQSTHYQLNLLKDGAVFKSWNSTTSGTFITTVTVSPRVNENYHCQLVYNTAGEGGIQRIQSNGWDSNPALISTTRRPTTVTLPTTVLPDPILTTSDRPDIPDPTGGAMTAQMVPCLLLLTIFVSAWINLALKGTFY